MGFMLGTFINWKITYKFCSLTSLWREPNLLNSEDFDIEYIMSDAWDVNECCSIIYFNLLIRFTIIS